METRVIEFVLDGRSRVTASAQLVQQVKQALRVGLLVPGNQLPKVRDVAASLAINPNTVLKAYRELVTTADQASAHAGPTSRDGSGR